MQAGRTAITEHALNHHHSILCEGTSVIGKWRKLFVKEARYIHLTAEDQRFIRDAGLDYLVAAGSQL